MGAQLAGLSSSPYQGRITHKTWKKFVPDLLIILTTIVYVPLTVADIYLQLKAERRVKGRWLWRGRLLFKRRSPDAGRSIVTGLERSRFWMWYEGVHAGVLLAAVVLLFVYVAELPRHARLAHEFRPYDADGWAPVRYFLPRRDTSDAAVAAWQAEHGLCAVACTQRVGPPPPPLCCRPTHQTMWKWTRVAQQQCHQPL